MNAPIEFRDAMRAAGLDYAGDIIPDGRLHRVKVNGDHNPNAWYVLHPDGIAAGSFGDWKRDITSTWCAKVGNLLTEAERAECDRKWRQQQAERDAGRQRAQAEARAQAQALLDAARPADDSHPYLLRKRVKAHPGVLAGPWPQRQRGNCLLIPLLTMDGRLATLQAIYPDKPDDGRDKDFLHGGAKRAAFFTIGELSTAPCIVIAEGYATASTIHEATGHAAVMACDAGNLRLVADAIRAAFPGKRIVIAADHDRATPGNPGLTKATEAAQAIKAELAIPEFADGEPGTDFNDLANLRGPAAVRDAIAQARPAESTAPADEDLFSDYGNVVKLLARLSGRLAYTPGMGWLLYTPDKGIWEPEPGAERVKNLALETLRDAWGAVLTPVQNEADELKRRLKELDSDDPTAAMVARRLKLAAMRRDKVFGWMRQCETAYRIRSTLEIAEGYFWTRPDSWDANPDILICNNGALDLASGRLLPHSPDCRATKTTGTDFIPGAHHPAWDAVVSLLKAEGDRYEFIQQHCGSGLHGANPNERVVIFQGDGGTGKGTLLTAIHRALGAYAETVEVGSLLATDWRKQNKSAPREDLLKLRGARFVYPSIEPPKDSKLDDGSIKALTGNDAITARAPHAQSSITFNPVFKLVIQTNFPLRTEFDDPGMKRRVIVVPFNQKPDRPDPAVKDALMNNPTARAACLAWLYEGYRAWRNAGYALPESKLATSATAEYWTDMNPYEQFAADVGLKFGKLERCHKPRMTGAFRAWREETGRLDASLKGFPGWLKGQGCFDQQETGGGRLWYGVGFPDGKSPESPKSPSVPGNSNVENEYPKSTFNFPGTAGDSGYSGYRTPADALSSHLGDASPPVDCGNSANRPDSGERKPSVQPGYPPVDNLPAAAGQRDRGCVDDL